MNYINFGFWNDLRDKKNKTRQSRRNNHNSRTKTKDLMSLIPQNVENLFFFSIIKKKLSIVKYPGGSLKC